MLTDPRDLDPIDMPEVIFSTSIKGIYDLRLLPGGFELGNGDRASGFRAELSWQSLVTGAREQIEVAYSVNCSGGDIWISKGHHGEVQFRPYPRDQAAFIECRRAWRDADVDAVVFSQKLEIGRYELLKVVDQWRWAFTADHLPRQQELVEDMATFVDQTMTALITQFPDHDHLFPTPDPLTSLGMR